MALATYFDKNAQAAAFLLRGLDSTALRGMLESERIAVCFDKNAVETEEGRAGLDLVIRLLSRLYPNIILSAADSTAKQYLNGLRVQAKRINPKISITTNLKRATRALVFGESVLVQGLSCANSTWYVGSHNWTAYLSMSKPVSSGNTSNPFGAGAAACLACANLFRRVFASQLHSGAVDKELEFSVYTLTAPKRRAADPVWRSIHLEDVHLVGAGAVGNGFLWAINRIDCTGTLHVIDHETVDESNLQRYAMAYPADEGGAKSLLAKQWLAAGKSHKLNVLPHNLPWAGYIEQVPGRNTDTVVSAVDSAQVRIQIQASLPKRIVNGWTQAGEAGVSRHDFLGDAACLACLYMPRGDVPNRDQLVLKALRLPDDQLKPIRQRLQQGTPTDRAFLELIATHSKVPLEALLPYEGRQINDLYVEAICGGAVMAFGSAEADSQAEVPMAFQSALAGMLLAAELVVKRDSVLNITQLDLLRPFPDTPSNPSRKSAKSICFCKDEDFKAQYRAKYGA